MANVEQKLLSHPFLRGISSENIRLVAEDASVMVFKPGEMILRRGRSAGYLFLIVSGKVSLGLLQAGNGPLTLSTLGRGEALGWSWMFPPFRWSFDAKAKTRVEVLAIEARPLLNKMGRYPLLGYELLRHLSKTLSDRLKAARHQMVRLYRQKSKSRTVYLPQPMF